MILMLIESRTPPERPNPPRRRWRRLSPRAGRITCRLAAAVGCMITGVVVGGLAGTVLVLLSVIAGCSAASVALPYTGGLTEHRQ
jgi:hypothetical protein